MAQKFVTNTGNASLTSSEEYKEQLKRCKVPIVEENLLDPAAWALPDKLNGMKICVHCNWRNGIAE